MKSFHTALAALTILIGFGHHVTLTVTDLSSVEWYERVLHIPKVANRTGDGWVRALLRSPSGLMIGLTEHDATVAGARFDHAVVGLDHLSVACADRADLEAWAAHLDDLGVDHSTIVDAAAGSLLVSEPGSESRSSSSPAPERPTLHAGECWLTLRQGSTRPCPDPPPVRVRTTSCRRSEGPRPGAADRGPRGGTSEHGSGA